MARRTLIDFFEDLSGISGEFLVFDDGYRTWSLTYRDTTERARAFAARLHAEGIVQGQHVVIWAENRPVWVVALWGCLLRGVVLVPEGDWGNRVAAAFDEELRAAGGYTLGQASYAGGLRNDFSDRIMQVLRTDDSRARYQRIQTAIGQKLEFEPRRRPDIQFIFAPSQQPGAARLLRPQLRYHLAGDIPTFTLGDAYEPHPTANREIDGMMFPDMPWMLGDTGLSAEVREAARQAYGDSAARRGRLFAFGFDAYRIASSLQRGGAPVIRQGLTGTLSLDERGRIRRELAWTRIHNGLPTPLLESIPDAGAIPSPAP